MKLSVLITALNESEEIIQTVESIRATSPAEVIVVDDVSDQEVKLPWVWAGHGVKLFRNKERLGVGGSRHLAAEHATGDMLLITDAHMRFVPGWYEAAEERIANRPNTLHCGTCLGLGYGTMDVTKANGKYRGATMVFCTAGGGVGCEIFEGKWLPDSQEDDFEMACLMGAIYFVPRDLFFKLHGLKMLKMWGTDEPYLSLKAWLSGADIRMVRNVEVGHMFRSSAPYTTGVQYLTYNKIRAMTELLDPEVSKWLISKIPEDGNKHAAMNLIEQYKDEIESERLYYKSIFTRTLDQYCERFNIERPWNADLSRPV